MYQGTTVTRVWRAILGYDRVPARADKKQTKLAAPNPPKRSELFQTIPQDITICLPKMYEKGELDEAATCKQYLQVQTDEVKPAGAADKSRGIKAANRMIRHSSSHGTFALGRSVASSCGSFGTRPLMVW